MVDLLDNFLYIYITQAQQNRSQQKGITVFGLYLDGAAWNERNECITKSVAGTRPQILPEIHFLPCLVSISNQFCTIIEFIC